MSLPIQTIWGSIKDALFPKKCLGCNAPGAHLCDKCAPDISRSSLFSADNVLPVISPFRYSDPTVRKIVWHLKYYGKSSLAEEMSQHMIEEFLAWLETESLIAPDEKILLIPIPIHGGRQRRRGYNQAELLAEQVAGSLGENFVLNKKLLKKVRATDPQARSHGRAERFENISRAFVAEGAKSPDSPHTGADFPIKVILIDDVVTSGATILEAKRALAESGYITIASVCFAHG